MAVGVASTWSAGKLPLSTSGVQSMLGAVSGALGGISKGNQSDFINKSVERLKAARDTVLGLEKNFYSQVGAKDLREIQMRLDELNNDAGFRSMVNLSDSEFDKIVRMAAQKEVFDFTKPVMMVFNDPNIQAQVAELSGAEEIGIQELIRAINSATGNGKTEIRALRGSSSGNRGLSKFICGITPKEIDGKTQYQVRFQGESIPSEWKARLEKELQITFSQEGSFSQRDLLRQEIQRRITNGKLKQYVLREFDANASQYDLNSSTASVKGFLGEVHTVAAINYLMGGYYAQATGNLRKVGSGEEIPIDVVLGEFGFQVKNYRTIENKVSFGNFSRGGSNDKGGMGAANFMSSRARIEEDLYKLLVSLFGAYQFNRTDPDGSGNFESTRNEITSLVNSQQIKDVFDAHIDNMLKVSEQFSTGEGTLFGAEVMYYNTFFMIGSKLIPASAILSAIITQLRKYQNNSIVAQYTFGEVTDSPKYEIEKPSENEATSAEAAANQIKITYKIDLNLNDILIMARNSAENFV